MSEEDKSPVNAEWRFGRFNDSDMRFVFAAHVAKAVESLRQAGDLLKEMNKRGIDVSGLGTEEEVAELRSRVLQLDKVSRSD